MNTMTMITRNSLALLANKALTKRGQMKWVLLTLLLFVTPNAQAIQYTAITGSVLSTTLIDALLPAEERFVDTVFLHFNNTKDCWGQKVLPSQKTIEKTIIGTIKNCRRFWPGQPERLCQFFSLIISESKGLNKGNPDDPSYGLCHATLEAAHTARRYYGMPHPKCKYCDLRCRGLIYKSDMTFKELLEEDLYFNIECGAGEAAMAEGCMGGDWMRGVLVYKFGKRGFGEALERLGDKPITEIRAKNGQYIWKNYFEVYMWVSCLNQRASVLSTSRCGCLPPELSR